MDCAHRHKRPTLHRACQCTLLQRRRRCWQPCECLQKGSRVAELRPEFHHRCRLPAPFAGVLDRLHYSTLARQTCCCCCRRREGWAAAVLNGAADAGILDLCSTGRRPRISLHLRWDSAVLLKKFQTCLMAQEEGSLASALFWSMTISIAQTCRRVHRSHHRTDLQGSKEIASIPIRTSLHPFCMFLDLEVLSASTPLAPGRAMRRLTG